MRRPDGPQTAAGPMLQSMQVKSQLPGSPVRCVWWFPLSVAYLLGTRVSFSPAATSHEGMRDRVTRRRVCLAHWGCLELSTGHTIAYADLGRTLSDCVYHSVRRIESCCRWSESSLVIFCLVATLCVGVYRCCLASRLGRFKHLVLSSSVRLSCDAS